MSPSGELSDSFQLLQSVQAGDRDAEEKLFRLYLPYLRRWARGRLPRGARSMMDTEDLVQDVMRRTLQNVGRIQYRRTGTFQAYLHRGIQNRVRDEVRKAARRPDMASLSEPIIDAPSPLEELIGRDTLQRYEKALERLSELDREAIVARIELGLSYADVAESLGKPSEDAARMAVSRALVKLVREMSNAG